MDMKLVEQWEYELQFMVEEDDVYLFDKPASGGLPDPDEFPERVIPDGIDESAGSAECLGGILCIAAWLRGESKSYVRRFRPKEIPMHGSIVCGYQFLDERLRKLGKEDRGIVLSKLSALDGGDLNMMAMAAVCGKGTDWRAYFESISMPNPQCYEDVRYGWH